MAGDSRYVHHRLTAVGSAASTDGTKLVQGTVGLDLVYLELDASWEEFDSVAVRFSGSGTTRQVDVKAGGPVTVPWEVLMFPGVVVPTLVGYVGTVERRVTTPPEGWECEPSLIREHAEDAEPSADVTAQMLETVVVTVDLPPTHHPTTIVYTTDRSEITVKVRIID